MSEKYTYHRKYIDADGNFRIIETRTADGRKRDITNLDAENYSDNQPYTDWIAAGGKLKDEDNEPYVEPTPGPTPQEIALARNRFTKQEVRRAFRSLGIESTLDTILDTIITMTINSNDVQVLPRRDWNDANEVLMNDPVLVAALANASIDIDTIKLEIAGLNNG
jgi:hypothetical protein